MSADDVKSAYLPTMPFPSFLELSGELFQKAIGEFRKDFNIRTPLDLAQRTIEAVQAAREKKKGDGFDPAVISALFTVLINCRLYNEKEGRYTLPEKREVDPRELAREMMERLLSCLGAASLFGIEVLKEDEDDFLTKLSIRLLPRDEKTAERVCAFLDADNMSVNDIELVIQDFLAFHLGRAFLVKLGVRETSKQRR